MKRMEVTQVDIGENHFYLKPFPAFVAANISGELAAIITPLLAGVVPMFVGDNAANTDNVMDMDIDSAMPAFTTALSTLSGDKFEKLMKKLLIEHRNISVESEATDGKVVLMTMDVADEVFCGEVQDMFVLCYHVIKLNFNGFFKKLGAQFGNLQGIFQRVTPRSESGENLISTAFRN